MHLSTPATSRRRAAGLAAALLVTTAAASAATTVGAAPSTYAPSAHAPKVINAVVAAVTPQSEVDAPFYAVFSTDTALKRSKNDEGTLGFPGGVGIDGPAAMTIYAPKTHAHKGDRWCYYAEASGTVWKKLRVGRSYPVLIALSNDKSVKRFNQPRKIRTRTIDDAAKALGC